MLRMLVVNIIPSVLEVLLVSSILVSIQGKEFKSCHLYILLSIFCMISGFSVLVIIDSFNQVYAP